MRGGRILWGQIAVVFTIILMMTWGATQWTAWRLGFQSQLGSPWFELAGCPIYYPPAFFWWWFSFGAYAPAIFIEGAIIAASGGLIAIAAAILRRFDEALVVIGGVEQKAHFFVLDLPHSHACYARPRTRSKHMDGTAFDIAMANHDPAAFEAAAREVGFLGFGFYPRLGLMHIDPGPARQWGERFALRETAFAAGVEVAQNILAGTQSANPSAGVASRHVTLGVHHRGTRRRRRHDLRPPR